MSIGEALRELSKAAGFTKADMATWCKCHHAAMRQWMNHDVEPHPVRKEYLEESLQILRNYLPQSTLLPVPMDVGQYQRKAYVEKARADAISKLPARNPAGRRRKMLDEHQG